MEEEVRRTADGRAENSGHAYYSRLIWLDIRMKQ